MPASLLLVLLACANRAPSTPAPPPVGLHDWTEGPLTLRLLEEGRGVVLRDHSLVLATLDLPHIPPDRYAVSVEWVDFDFDGQLDLRVVNADDSGAYNVFHTHFRRDGDRFERCSSLSEEHNVTLHPVEKRLSATSLGNGLGASGVRKTLKPHGCQVAVLGTLQWITDLQSEEGEATCTVGGVERWKTSYRGAPPPQPCP